MRTLTVAVLVAASMLLSLSGPKAAEAAGKRSRAAWRTYTPSRVELDRWVRMTAALESGGDVWAVNSHEPRGGPSRGAFQIQRRTWERYSDRPWEQAAHDWAESRRVAELILIDCARACKRKGRPVTFESVRWFYRRGGF